MSNSIERRNKLLVQIPITVALVVIAYFLVPDIRDADESKVPAKPDLLNQENTIRLNLSEISNQVSQDNVRLEDCFRAMYNLDENEVLSVDHLTTIAYIRIRKADLSDRGYTDYEFASGFEALNNFSLTLNQSDAVTVHFNQEKLSFLQSLSHIPNLRTNSD